jgi:serine protease Do
MPTFDDRQRRLLQSLDLSHPDHVPESYGSGLVIDDAGLILTCAHVVRNATKVYVRLPGNRGSWADVQAADPRSDLAVLRLLDRVTNLKALPLGDGGTVKKGQFVIALANPFAAGFRDGSPSASWGIISNVRRRAPGSPNETDRTRQTLHQFGTLLQTDVRLNLGSSGGAILNLRGELIGVTTALAAISGSETPGGFAVPLDHNLRRIIEVLRRGEEVEYGFLGVQMHPDTRSGPGVQIGAVADGSPAQRAKLIRGDYIFTVNGVPVHDNDDLFLQIGINLAGTEVRIEAAHRADGPRQTLTAKLAKYLVKTPIVASKRPPALGGLRVDYTSILSQRDGAVAWVRGIPEGVAIREVLTGSPADKEQLQTDKVITRVNNVPVKSPREYYAQVERNPQRIELTFLNSEGREERVTLVNPR